MSVMTPEEINFIKDEIDKFWKNADPGLSDAQAWVLVTNLMLRTAYTLVDLYPNAGVETRLAEAVQAFALLILQRPFHATAGVPVAPGSSTIN